MNRKILHGLDGSPTSFKALEEAIYMAQKYEAELHTITVEQLPRYAGAMGEVIEEKATADGKFHEFIKKAKEMAENKGLNLTPHLMVGHDVKNDFGIYKKTRNSTSLSLVSWGIRPYTTASWGAPVRRWCVSRRARCL